MKDFRDYYRVLGVARTATADEIRVAYRRAARRHHPDVSQAADAAARMAEVNEAYAVLSDAAKRRNYDHFGARHGEPGPAGMAGAAQPSPGADLFSSIFGRRRPASARRPSDEERRHAAPDGADGSPFRGGDQESSVEITVAESYQGATRRITLRAPAMVNAAAVGHGRRPTTRTLEVQIPKGVRDGQRIRLAGQGLPSLNGGRPGDLHLEVRLRPDPQLRVDGKDVYQKLPVAPWEAALGASVEAPTVAGRIALRIPPGSQNGRRLRLRGKGLPAAEPGDLYLEIDVVLPAAETDAARRIYAQMAREMAFDPRAGMAAEPGPG